MSRSETPLTGGERAALRSFRRAALTSRGYRAHLQRLGVDHRQVSRLSQVPFTDKASVFGDHIDFWVDGGSISEAAELLTSSGSTGLFSVGVTSRSERRSQERSFDAVVRSLGGGEGTTTLLLNCLPMGISIPTRLATIATPSVHVEMAVELLARAGSGFDRVVIAAEPIFLKELAETALRERGPRFGDNVVACFVGGEWVAESWRRYVSELFGFTEGGDRLGVMVSMGAAEVGLNALYETPPLRAARRVLESPAARRGVFGRDRGYAPSLFAWDSNRFFVEERHHEDDTSSLVLTALTRRMLPLVRYDLDDEAQLVEPDTINAELEANGSDLRLDAPVVALWGRRGSEVRGDGWTMRPELVKEGLFTTAAHAGALTGRFRIATDRGNPVLHVQLRNGALPGPSIEAALSHIASMAAGTGVGVQIHAYREYPYHEAGDFQHKTAYVQR